MDRSKALLLCLLFFGVAGCADSEPRSASSERSQVQRQAGFLLPVSLNEVMVALVNDAADPLWVAAWKSPSSDPEWRELERRAYQLELAGTLIAFPGTGALDKTWTIKPAWRDWSRRLREAGSEAVTAVKARDIKQIATAGDRIVEICEGCHIEFKLPMPTGGKFGELSPTPGELEDPDGS